NQAGFSTGTCAAGGGASCTGGSCRFGSTPCSLSACPPNAAADSAGGGYTWFAAPCSSAPSGDASCPGSSWCPVGDRACWNLLIYAPASNTGQIAIKGTAAEHWLLGSVYWPGTCTDTVNGPRTLAGIASLPLIQGTTTGVKVVVASHDIQARTVIQDSDLTLASINPTPPQSFTAVNKVAGKGARVDIPAGMPISSNLVAPSGDLVS